MSKSEVVNVSEGGGVTETTAPADALVRELAQHVERLLAAGDGSSVSPAAVQALTVAAVRLYVSNREAGDRFAPFEGEQLTATEVVVIATNLLKAADLEVIELTMWNGFGSL